MLSITFILLLCAISIVLFVSAKKGEPKTPFFHQRQDQYKNQPGWQEPGLWRPRWIMERTFYATEEGGKEHSDRLYLKMKNDRTIKVYTSKTRPKFQWLKKAKQGGGGRKEKNMFETGAEADLDVETQIKMKKLEEERLYDADGTWWWQDEAPALTGKVKIEIRDKKKNTSEDEETMEGRTLHEGRCDWGKLDGYAALFRKGQMMKYKGGTGGVPFGTYKVGQWTMRANVHRPLISKEFVAFQ